MLDPFSLSNNFEGYSKMFSLVASISPDLQKEFEYYFTEPVPTNPEIKIMDYWKKRKILYSNLSDAAVQLLSISTGSCDVERLFSLMRNVQQPNQSCMSEKTLCMELTLYYNKDLDQSFDFL